MGIAYGQVWGKKHHANQPLTSSVPESYRGYKRCILCKVVRPLDEFAVDDNRIDGRSNTCLTCESFRGVKH